VSRTLIFLFMHFISQIKHVVFHCAKRCLIQVLTWFKLWKQWSLTLEDTITPPVCTLVDHGSFIDLVVNHEIVPLLPKDKEYAQQCVKCKRVLPRQEFADSGTLFIVAKGKVKYTDPLYSMQYYNATDRNQLIHAIEQVHPVRFEIM